MSQDCGRKPDKTHAGTGRVCKLTQKDPSWPKGSQPLKFALFFCTVNCFTTFHGAPLFAGQMLYCGFQQVFFPKKKNNHNTNFNQTFGSILQTVIRNLHRAFVQTFVQQCFTLFLQFNNFLKSNKPHSKLNLNAMEKSKCHNI